MTLRCPPSTTIITLSPNKPSLFGDTLVNNVGWHHWSVRPLCPWQSGTWCRSRGQKDRHDFVPTGVVICDSSSWLCFQMARLPSYYAYSAHTQIHPNTRAARNKFYSFLALPHFAIYCSSFLHEHISEKDNSTVRVTLKNKKSSLSLKYIMSFQETVLFKQLRYYEQFSKELTTAWNIQFQRGTCCDKLILLQKPKVFRWSKAQITS